MTKGGKIGSNYYGAIETYNTKLIKIWQSSFKVAVEKFNAEKAKRFKIKFLPPLLHLAQSASPIWFLGMNPSDSKHTPNWEHECQTEITASLKKTIEQQQTNSLAKHKYFQGLKDFYQDNSLLDRSEKALPIFHDMYPVRHTNQKEFEAFLKSAPDLKKELDDANKAFLKEAAPKVIVVFNSKASEYIKELFGIHELSITTTNTITEMTFVYSSMYTGQRALDKYARMRLAREIKDILGDMGL
jgi:hypothetical protein